VGTFAFTKIKKWNTIASQKELFGNIVSILNGSSALSMGRNLEIYHIPNVKGPVAPTPVKVNCRLKCFVTLVTYCYNNVFVYFNL
jgi:hypothetical protein